MACSNVFYVERSLLKTLALGAPMTNVLKKSSACFFTFLLFASLTLASDPPWKGKPYEQWDDKDIQRVFSDSPWSRKGTITRTWTALSAKDLPNANAQRPGGAAGGGGRAM